MKIDNENDIPVVDSVKSIRNPKEENIGLVNIPINKIKGLGRPLNRDDKYLQDLLKVLMDKETRTELFNKNPIDAYEYNKNYFILNGNHRCYLFKKYKNKIRINTIPARVIKITEK